MSTPCPQDEQLVRLLEEALDGTEARALEHHIACCARCQGVLEALRTLDAVISEPEAPSHEFVERLLALPDTAPARPAAGRLLALAAASAAIILLAAGLRAILDTHEDAAQDLRAAAPPARPPEPSETVIAESTLLELSVPALHRLARGDDPGLARRALVRLGRIGRRESLPVLLAVVRKADRRAEAVEALGAVGDPRAVPTLASLLCDARVADAARDALVQVGGGEAARALGRVLEGADDPQQVALLTDAIARADGSVAVRRLARLLEHRDPSRVGAARAAIRRHEARLLSHAVDELARSSAADVDSALRVLGVLAPPAAVPALRRLLEQRGHRARTAEVLAQIDTAEAAEALFGAVRFTEVRQSFRRAGPATERWLLAGLGRGSRHAQRLAIDLLGLCGSTQAVPPLAALVDDPALAPGVLLALGRIGGEAAVVALTALARRPTLQRRAVQALGMTGCPAAVVELERLGADVPKLRVDAQRALATIPCAEAVEAIVRLDGGWHAHRSTERTLRGMDRDLVLTTLDGLLDGAPPAEGHVVATARRVRRAVGGAVLASKPRVALD